MIYTKDVFQVIMIPNETIVEGNVVKVYYRKPNTQAIVEKQQTGLDFVNNKVIYELSSADNNAAGKWQFWCRVWNGDGKPATSTPVTIDVHLAGM